MFDKDNLDGSVSGRGMQYQAAGMERLIANRGTSTLMTPRQPVATLDEIRAQIGLTPARLGRLSLSEAPATALPHLIPMAFVQMEASRLPGRSKSRSQILSL